MDFKQIVAAVLEIAEDVASRTENTKDDIAVAILKSLFDRFGPTVFGTEGAGDWKDPLAKCCPNCPDDCLAKLDELAAQIEAPSGS